MGVKAGDHPDLLLGQGGLAVSMEEQVGHQALIEVHQTLGKAVLPLKLKDVEIEIPVFLHVLTQRKQAVPPVAQGDVIAEDGGDLGIKDPGDEIILIFEVIVEGVAADFALPGDVPHGDVDKGCGFQQPLEPLGDHQFGKCSVRHRSLPPLLVLETYILPLFLVRSKSFSGKDMGTPEQ